MKSPSERFHELIAGISDERIAALAARLADPDDPGHTREVKWRDDPDPFGMDWAWLQPEAEPVEIASAPPSPEAPEILTMPPTGERGVRFVRRTAYGVAMAAAACLLIALGALIAPQLPGGGTQILVASASPVYGVNRGVGDSPQPRVGMRSDLAGYATVIALAPDRRPDIYPGPGADDIAVTAATPREYGPLPPATARVLFVVTETPAGETVRKALRGKTYGPESIDRLKADLTASLRAKGYRRMAFGEATFSTVTE